DAERLADVQRPRAAQRRIISRWPGAGLLHRTPAGRDRELARVDKTRAGPDGHGYARYLDADRLALADPGPIGYDHTPVSDHLAGAIEEYHLHLQCAEQRHGPRTLDGHRRLRRIEGPRGLDGQPSHGRHGELVGLRTLGEESRLIGLGLDDRRDGVRGLEAGTHDEETRGQVDRPNGEIYPGLR